MSSTSSVPATGSGTTTGTGTTGTSGSGSSSTTFQTALASSVQDARTLTTTTLGSMVAKAQDQGSVIAVSRPVQVAPTTSAGTAQSLTGASSTSSSSKAGGKGAIKVPDELQAYGNGKIPAEALDQIGIKKHKLWNVAAEQFKAMRTAAAADGVDIGVTDSYRPYEEQVDLVRRKGLYSQGGLAAKPGTSPHGWGMALDVDVTPAGLSWLREHGAEYGWVEAVPREPWHWEYHGNK